MDRKLCSWSDFSEIQRALRLPSIKVSPYLFIYGKTIHFLIHNQAPFGVFLGILLSIFISASVQKYISAVFAGIAAGSPILRLNLTQRNFYLYWIG